MAEDAVIAISFKDLAIDEPARERTEKRCRALTEEFPESTRIEVTFAEDGEGYSAHVHATGRHEAAASASGAQLSLAADRALERLGKALRRAHDKRIFSRRREAMQQNPKRRPRS
jgi:ribosome-associated translation inhibitor RaiA